LIVIDTHIWIWWVHGAAQLRPWMQDVLMQHEPTGIGVSAISCLEVARLMSTGALATAVPSREWLRMALRYPGMHLLQLAPDIAAEAYSLPGEFHKDPADRIIVATARVLGCELLTADDRILDYPHVKLLRET
jgi:PIN domain nuclease of toxin-antitoxin system